VCEGTVFGRHWIEQSDRSNVAVRQPLVVFLPAAPSTATARLPQRRAPVLPRQPEIKENSIDLYQCGINRPWREWMACIRKWVHDGDGKRGLNRATCLDRRRGFGRARVCGARLGSTGSEPRRIGAVGSAHDRGSACGDGSLGDAAVLDVRYQFGDAGGAPPGLTSCLAWQDGRASSREGYATKQRYRQPAEPGGTRPAAGGKHVNVGGCPCPWHGAAERGRYKGTECSAL
jgi:hypothetical protein